MIKRLLIAVAMLCAVTEAQVPVTPITQPHMTFVDAAGNPCAGCKLYTYTAGTTTPFPTYTDATGTSQNTNPIILGADGGPQTPSGSSGGIWLGRNSYKFILKDALGNVIWTADNVNAASLFPCSTPSSVQIANLAANGLDCDGIITINKTNHTFNIGSLPAGHVSIGALGTPTLWNFDTSTPATALASLGGGLIAPGTINQLAFYAAAGMNISGTSAIPSGITGTTQAPSDNSTKLATTAYVALPGVINPTSVQVASGTAMTGNQGTGTLVQHATGTTTTGNCPKYDATGSLIDSGASCSGAAVTGTFTDVTGSRTFGTSYQNTSGAVMHVAGYGVTSGSSVGSVEAKVGSASPTNTAYAMTCAATVNTGACGFSFDVPNTYFYSISANTKTNSMGSAVGSVGAWTELVFSH